FLLASCDVIDGPLYRGSATYRIFEAALGFEGNDLPFYERMVNQDNVSLHITVPLPRGVGKMKSLRRLSLVSRSVKDVSALAELCDVEGPFDIEWFLKKIGIEALAPIADKVDQLIVGWDATRDYGVLARFTKLRRLSMGGDDVGPLRDLSPLA